MDESSVQAPSAIASHFSLFALMSRQALEAERVAIAFAQQRQALLEEHADNELVRAAVWKLSESEDAEAKIAAGLKKDIRRYCPEPAMLDFVSNTHGLGNAAFLFLGLLPQWVGEFKTVSKLWAYCGLHVVNGQAPRLTRGAPANWSPFLKAVAIKRLAEPCMKHRASPYRSVYDSRRASTEVTHTDWPDGHRHRDAMRVTAKAILRDLWRIGRGLSAGETVATTTPIFESSPSADLGPNTGTAPNTEPARRRAETTGTTTPNSGASPSAMAAKISSTPIVHTRAVAAEATPCT